MRAELGIAESGLMRVVRGAFGLLRLLAFFTAGEDKPAQSWHLRRGLTAWHAAGPVHTDIQRGFVRRTEEHTPELQSRPYLGCRLLLEKKNLVCRLSV